MASDVFVSYSSADRVLADAIVHELETEGIGCWIAPRNILPGANYSEAIVAAIQNVEVMVVVVSDDANRSGHVPREVERAAAHNVSLVPFRIADIKPSPSLEYFLSCQHWLHALPPPVEAHVTRLVDAVAALLALRRRPATLEAEPAMSKLRGDHRTRHTAATRGPARVPAPVAVFTGRTAERAEIRRQLAEFPVVTLVGPPGAGKTELARVVATDLEASTVAYVDLSALSVRSSLATTVATAVGLDPAATWDETVQALGDTDAVLVLDNAETALAVDADDFRRSLRNLVDHCRSCRILATSRERLGMTGAESIVRVGPLTSQEAEDLLDKLLISHACSLSADDRDAMAQVHAVADGLPLALVFSAAWLSEVSVSTFLQEWQRSRTALLSLPGFDSPDRASSLGVSVSLSFDTLKADSRQVLHALSLHPAGVTTELLEKILPEDVALVPSTAELVRKSLVEKTGPHLRVLAPIREFVRAGAPDESVEPLLLAAIERHRHQLHERLSNAYRIDSGAEWERLAHDLANVGALVDDGFRLSNTVEPAIELVAAACLVFRSTGRIDEIGFRLHEKLGDNPLARGDATECLADVARVTGDWHRAIALYTDAQRKFRSVPDGLVGMTNTAHSLGETRLAIQDVDGARIDYDNALQISQRIGDLQGQANALLGLAKTDLMREEFEGLTRRSISFEESQRWPLEKKGSVFHGSLEATG